MDELLGKKVPHSAEAERAVVGSMLIDSRCIPDVVEKLKVDDFYIKQNRDIFETIHGMFSFGRVIDPVTILDAMKERGVYTESSFQYLQDLIDRTPTAANVLEYAAIVSDRALLRRLGEAADGISNEVYEGNGDADTVLESAERTIYALRQGRITGGLTPLSTVVQTVFDNLAEAAKSERKIPGIPTGFVDLDKKLLGLNKSELIIIAARPGMGKTSIALNIGMHAGIRSHKTVAVFSLEMSREELTKRFLSGYSLVPGQNLMTGQLTDHQWQLVTEAAETLSASNILVDDNPNLTVSDINAQCRRLKQLDLVIIDYLQLMQSSGSGKSWANESRVQAVSDMSRMLKIMAKELNVPVICLSQMSRANERDSDKRPTLSSLRESGSIEQDADVVLGLYRDGYYNRECTDPNKVEAIVLKNRKGETGTVYMRWLPEYTSFVDNEAYREEDL